MGYEEHALDAAAAALDAAAAVWRKMHDGELPLGHDGYLKAWALTRPDLGADIAYVDEAQDLNPVLMGVLKNFTGQRICVGDRHQQIYEWRGAIDALKYLKGRRRYLTQSFRFGEQIAATANVILGKLGEEKPLIGSGPEGEVHMYSKDNPEQIPVDSILCRSNAGVIKNLIKAIEEGHKVFVPGGMGELMKLVSDAQRLEQGRKPDSGELMAFHSWEDVKTFSESTEGEHLKVFVKLVEDWGTGSLLKVLREVSRDDHDALTISTAHKGKGLEWDRVVVDDDFYVGSDIERLPGSAFRLLYVAMTRARKKLYLPEGLLSQYRRIEVYDI